MRRPATPRPAWADRPAWSRAICFRSSGNCATRVVAMTERGGGNGALRRPGIDETALVDTARRLAPRVADGGVLYLEGSLGAGKTTFARALLRALGVGERVKSPTYTLIES